MRGKLKLKIKDNQKWMYIIGGVVAGVLLMWLVVKLTKPVVESACRYVLSSGDKQRERGGAKAIKIEAAVVEMGKISKRIKTIGKLRANQFVTISSEINGRIKEIPFEQGSFVEEGATLIQFEDDTLVAELNQAKAEFEMNKAAYDRLKKLYDKNIESAKNLEEVRSKSAASEARVEAAEARVRQASIKSPFSGQIGIIDVSPGQYVQSGKELVQLADNSRMLVDFKIPEKMAGDVGSGQTAEVFIEGHERPYRALVQAVDSQVDVNSHSISIRAEIVTEEIDGLVPGTFADVSLIIGERNNAILIPDSAVSRRGDVEYVWKIVKGRAKAAGVLTGTREKGKVEVTAGLRPGDIVVTVGQIRLGEGYKVDITNMPGYDVDNETKTRQNLEDSKHPNEESPAKREKVEKSSEAKAAGSSVDGDSDAQQAEEEPAESDQGGAADALAQDEVATTDAPEEAEPDVTSEQQDGDVQTSQEADSATAEETTEADSAEVATEN